MVVHEEAALYEAPPLHRFTRKDYHAMAEAGILTKRDRVELIDGRIIAMRPIGAWHCSSNSKLNFWLNCHYGDRAIVVMGNPVGLGNDSEPQPDVTALKWLDDSYASAQPEAEDIILLIEVSDTTRAFDLGTKQALCAREGVEEFWVVDRQLEGVHVFRHPHDGAYRESRLHTRGEDIPLPECSGASLAVTETGL